MVTFNDYSYVYVEDDVLSREVMQIILQDAMGIERVWMFADSDQLIRRLHALPTLPDIILLDIHVEPLDGVTLLKLLRDDPTFSRARIIALTASVMTEEVDRLRSAGFDGGIAKPISLDTFPKLMERILKGETVWHIT